MAAMKRLPLISPTGVDSRPNTALGRLADVVDRENPYEQTWSILRALKAEVRELQAALHAEQHMRDEEVGRLHRELAECREELAKEKAERKQMQGRQLDDHKQEGEKLMDDLRKARSLRDQQVRMLTESLEDEKKKRSQDVRDLGERIKAEEATRAKETKGLTDLLADTRRRLDVTWASARDHLHNLTQDVKLMANQLTRVSSTWSGFSSERLMTQQSAPLLQSPRPFLTAMTQCDMTSP